MLEETTVYGELREGAYYVCRGGCLLPVRDPVEIEAELMVSPVINRTCGRTDARKYAYQLLSGKLAALLPGVWTVKTSSEGLAGTRYTARVLILPPEK